jgi:YesN/AraC family two-component response regulator
VDAKATAAAQATAADAADASRRRRRGGGRRPWDGRRPRADAVTRVLIADDEPLVRLAVRSLEDWRAADIDFPYEAANGEEALSLVEAHPEIDVVLVDVDMPVMNGLELAEKLAERGEGPAVLFLSSFDTFEFARRAFKAGAHDYILKSEMDEGRLLAALRGLIERRGRRAAAREPTAAEKRDAFGRLLPSRAPDTSRLADSFRASLPASSWCPAPWIPGPLKSVR